MNEVSYIDREKSECKDCLWWGKCEVRLEDCKIREGMLYANITYVSDEKIRELAERCEETLKRLGE